MAGPQRVLLVGMMGAGKSVVGRPLAARLGWDCLDNDDLVLRARGRSLDDLLEAEGEDGLRAAETDALGVALITPPPLVAGVAGGVVLDAGNRARLAAEPGVVWLRATVATLVRRIGHDPHRPWLRPDPEARLREMVAAREPLYAEVAHLVVDVDARAPEDVAAEIVSALDL